MAKRRTYQLQATKDKLVSLQKDLNELEKLMDTTIWCMEGKVDKSFTDNMRNDLERLRSIKREHLNSV